MEKSIMIYDGDKFVMELVTVEVNGTTEYFIKKANYVRLISCERYNMYIDLAKYAGYDIKED